MKAKPHLAVVNGLWQVSPLPEYAKDGRREKAKAAVMLRLRWVAAHRHAAALNIARRRAIAQAWRKAGKSKPLPQPRPHIFFRDGYWRVSVMPKPFNYATTQAWTRPT